LILFPYVLSDSIMPRALTIKQVEGKPGQVYYPWDSSPYTLELYIDKHSLSLDTVPAPSPSPNDLKIQIYACALNHRDLFIRQHLYPGVAFSVPLLADGCGTVVATGSSASSAWLNKRVILVPGRGWTSSPDGPESPIGTAILGGTKTIPFGTAQDVVCVSEVEVEEAPAHLSNAQAAALPLTGLTAWRALVTKSANALPGRNILVTGIGGGVALMALQFAVEKGCKVFVTSGSEEKIRRAVEMGAVGGVNYKSASWDKDLMKMLPKERPFIDAIIDGAGGDIMTKGAKILKVGIPFPYIWMRLL
jgi:NADPH:quinone reductase-like Zn-dependent oxidoreductase